MSQESPNEIRVGRQSDFDERIARAIGLLTVRQLSACELSEGA